MIFVAQRRRRRRPRTRSVVSSYTATDNGMTQQHGDWRSRDHWGDVILQLTSLGNLCRLTVVAHRGVQQVRRCCWRDRLVCQTCSLELHSCLYRQSTELTHNRGVMWSRRRVLVSRRAAAFCTDCTFLSGFSGTPHSSELHQSRPKLDHTRIIYYLSHSGLIAYTPYAVSRLHAVGGVA